MKRLLFFFIFLTGTCVNAGNFNVYNLLKTKTDLEVIEFSKNNFDFLQQATSDIVVAAVAEKRYELVNDLIEAGFMVDGKESQTPLCFAAELGDHKMIQLLLSHGANPNPADTLAPVMRVILSLKSMSFVRENYFTDAKKSIDLLLPVTVFNETDFVTMESFVSQEKDSLIKKQKAELLAYIRTCYQK